MDKKIGLIIIGLAGILVISLFLNLQTYGSKQGLEHERDALKRENTLLVQKVAEGIKESNRLQEKIATLNSDLTSASQAKEELEKKFQLLTEEKEDLAKKIKERPAIQTPGLPEHVKDGEDAYWGAMLQAKADLEMQVGSLREELKTLQFGNEQLQTEKANLELEVKGLKRDQLDLKRQMDYNQKIMDSLSQEIVREKNDKFQIESSLKTVKNENAILKRQLRSLENRKLGLERKFAKLQQDKGELADRLTELETVLQQKTVQIESLNKQLGVLPRGDEEERPVELSPIVVRPQAEVAELAGSFLGKVLAVNRENKFVVVDLGEDTGVKIGDSFQVYREDKSIGAIEVIQIRKNISACDIKKETTSIRPGDTIK